MVIRLHVFPSTEAQTSAASSRVLGGANLPDWMPPAVADALQLSFSCSTDSAGGSSRARHVAPVLNSLAGGPISTVAPSTTATALSSIATGLTPAEHGILGYRMLMRGAVTNMLRWATDEGVRRHDVSPRELQPARAFCGQRVPYVTSQELIGSSFSDAHLFGGVAHGYRALSSLPVVVSELVRSGATLCTPTTRASTKLPMSEGSESFMTPNLHVPTEWLMTCSTVYRVTRSCSSLPITAKSRSAIDFSTPLMIYFD